MAGTDIGTAYVHIVPSAEGISGNIKKAIGADVDSAGESAGQSFGAKLDDAIRIRIIPHNRAFSK